jgi:hypothetical protein
MSYFAILFGVATIISGGQNLFNQEVIQQQGHVVPVVLWYNFIAGIFYILAAFGVIKQKRIALRLTSLISSLNIVVFFYLIIHILDNGSFETKTLIAMSFRTTFWFVYFVILSRSNQYKIDCNC